ncbi:tetratricopeptide repeat protein [Marinobacter changyiensis]|uniref:tetratricopeptide repeat protein n=1 Tax=Marinobacter changyiensis TaxID=2604091 RepID=UPI0012655BD2|nr:tetratricopeptide repeat protein [Marinobacter changyiensis]
MIDRSLDNAVSNFEKGNLLVAFDELEVLAEEGVEESYSFLGNIYEHGLDEGGPDYERANYWYEKSLDTVGSVAAYLGLIRINYYGLGEFSDYRKAFCLSRELSEEKKHPYAYFFIGKMFLHGKGVEKDLNRAFLYFEKSWCKGYVFGMTYMGITAQEQGKWFKSWRYRLKAACYAYRISLMDKKSQRIREL